MSHPRVDSPPVNPVGVWTIVVAGGSGLRFGARKQFIDLDGKSVISHAVDTAAQTSEGVIAVVPGDAVSSMETALGWPTVSGGDTRAGSVRAGLDAVPDSAEVIIVHDAARPLATSATFARVITAVRQGAKAVVPAVPLADSIRHVEGYPVDRSTLRAVQTPQGFEATALRDAHAAGGDASDDATLVGELGHDVVIVDGDPENRKLTVASDLISAEALLLARRTEETH